MGKTSDLLSLLLAVKKISRIASDNLSKNIHIRQGYAAIKSLLNRNQIVTPNTPNKLPQLQKKLHIFKEKQKVVLTPSKVPANRINRLANYGGIASRVGLGMLTEATKRLVGVSKDEGNLLLNQSNLNKIVDGLSRMRGAALKLGQMLSIQDQSILSPDLEQILKKVQNSANYMPDSQLEKVMTKEFGQNWIQTFSTFDRTPIAAASLGQVHLATLEKKRLAVKIQYPGVSKSINSDLDNLKTLLVFSNLLPKGLYLDNTINAARVELANECDYDRECYYMGLFRDLVEKDKELVKFFNVPRVYKELSTKNVLVADFVEGVAIGDVEEMDQSTKDLVGEAMLRLCLSELFDFGVMQSDPNWTNFLYNQVDGKINLIDFGATREYDKKFVEGYLELLHSASIRDTKSCIFWSKELKFLTGFESQLMLDAHINSLFFLAEPFFETGEKFDFAAAHDITNRVKSNIPVMLRERLAPPPVESYSIHRKLSGLFLLCAKLGSKIESSRIFFDYYKKFKK